MKLIPGWLVRLTWLFAFLVVAVCVFALTQMGAGERGHPRSPSFELVDVTQWNAEIEKEQTAVKAKWAQQSQAEVAPELGRRLDFFLREEEAEMGRIEQAFLPVSGRYQKGIVLCFLVNGCFLLFLILFYAATGILQKRSADWEERLRTGAVSKRTFWKKLWGYRPSAVPRWYEIVFVLIALGSAGSFYVMQEPMPSLISVHYCLKNGEKFRSGRLDKWGDSQEKLQEKMLGQSKEAMIQKHLTIERMLREKEATNVTVRYLQIMKSCLPGWEKIMTLFCSGLIVLVLLLCAMFRHVCRKASRLYSSPEV